MSHSIQKREFAAEIEVRNEEADDVLNVVGHAAVFGERTLIGSPDFGFVEVIERGAFDEVLGDDARFLLNHGGMPMARVKNGTLRQSVDSIGLVTDADLNPKMQAARDLHAAIARGDIDQMSFAFRIAQKDGQVLTRLSKDDSEYPGMVLRTITKIDRLVDHSAVTLPAYDGTDIGARGLDYARRCGVDEVEIRGILDLAEAVETRKDVDDNPVVDQTDTTEGRVLFSNEDLGRILGVSSDRKDAQ